MKKFLLSSLNLWITCLKLVGDGVVVVDEGEVVEEVEGVGLPSCTQICIDSTNT
ncbi:hypothetical protein [Acidianus sp. RZ1]|uniref:hypothetical protein n=1 Tax=Acidianus sp. RZ1 TaxID=1540082 RepID=UPI0014911FB6|nr:hypothetical protein [Acidianus sp. RZ1]NON61250.1 hypothetical protein [Acidianus sp. RZ1]